MPSIKPILSFEHKCLTGLNRTHAFHEFMSSFKWDFPAGISDVTYTFTPIKEDPNFPSLDMGSVSTNITKIISFPSTDMLKYYAVLFHVYSVLKFIGNFLLVNEQIKIATHNDGLGTITVERGLVKGSITISYADKWVKEYTCDNPVLLIGEEFYDKELIDLLTQIKDDALVAQEEMLARDGSLDKFTFHIYEGMNGTFTYS